MKRERHFEVMRTIAMFFIVMYHCLTHGVGGEYGFSTLHPITLFNMTFSDLLLVFSSISVNLYVMVSGYFLSDLDFKMSRIIRTWFNACFYSFAITILFMSIGIIPFSIISFGKSFFPISTDAYWFVTQYIGLLILSPFLAMLVKHMSYRQYLALLIGGAFICLSILPDFPLGKRFHVAHGNSVWSFAYLFLVAGFIKHHMKELPSVKLIVSIIFVTLIILGLELFFGIQDGSVHLYWFNYNGIPFILSVLVFIFVKQLPIPKMGIWDMLIKVAPYTFGVYLIHDHLIVRDWLWNTIPLQTYCDKIVYPFVIVGLCLAIFAIGALVDAVRKKLFDFLKIDDLIAKVDSLSFTH